MMPYTEDIPPIPVLIKSSAIYLIYRSQCYVWSITHNVVHHTYTNIPGHDEDIEVAQAYNLISPRQDQQNSKIPAFLCFSSIWICQSFMGFQKGLCKFSKKIGHMDNTKHPKVRYLDCFSLKGFITFCLSALPLIVLDITWWQFIIGSVTMHFGEGLGLGLVFQTCSCGRRN